jgi:hypothetical protein
VRVCLCSAFGVLATGIHDPMVQLKEQFVVSLSPDAPDFPGDGELTPELLDETLRELAECDFDPRDIEVQVGSAGYGAEGFILLSVFSGLAVVFLSGKKIEENIAAWIKLGRRFRALSDRSNKKGRGMQVSQPVALALALERLNNDFGELAGSTVLASHVIPVRNRSIPPELEPLFESQPDRFYIFLVKLPDDDTCVVGMKSDGTVVFQHRLPTSNYLRYFGIIGEDGKPLK